MFESDLFSAAVAVPKIVAPKPVLEAEVVQISDFRGDTRRDSGSWKQRAADNIHAIETLQKIEAEARTATPDEQRDLAAFVGFGNLPQLFPVGGKYADNDWASYGERLKAIVSAEEHAALAQSTQYAHYTPGFIVEAMWDAVRRLGFNGGQVLEPGCGTGVFMAHTPADLRCAWNGIERDSITARIAKLLHPGAWIQEADFTETHLSSYDLVIGNPPFSDRTVRSGQGEAGKAGLALHDYFIGRSLESLKPGGLAAFVVSRWTMDKQTTTARDFMAARADLVGAIRLPRGAMSAEAGTDVVVDVLFFRKRAEGAAPGGHPWRDIVLVGEGDIRGEKVPLEVNEFFYDNPLTVLGEHTAATSQFGPAYTCKRLPEPLDELLATSIEEQFSAIDWKSTTQADSGTSETETGGNPPEDVVDEVAAAPIRYVPPISVRTVAEGGTIREGSYFVDEGKLWQVIDGCPVEISVRDVAAGTKGTAASHAKLIRSFIPLRDAVRDVLARQEADQPFAEAQATLATAYAAFVKAHGPINKTETTMGTDRKTGLPREIHRRPNLAPLRDDPDVWLVAAIENYDQDTGKASKCPIFTQRVLLPPAERTISAATDALAVVLNETGKVDLARICEVMGGQPVGDVLRALGTTVYLDPKTDEWVTADEYLSGPVRDKLKLAESKADDDPAYERNVAALEAVQPVDLKPSEITARLGAPWIPADVVEKFALMLLVPDKAQREALPPGSVKIFHTPSVAAWTVHIGPLARDSAASSTFGTKDRHAGELLEDALNAKTPAIYVTVIDADGTKKQILDPVRTEAAKDKLNRIKAAFSDWVWQNPPRADRLARIYNDQFNNLVTRRFDGSHLELPGANDAVKLNPHQKDAVWRIVQTGNTYLAHVVGAGKAQPLDAKILTPTGWKLMGEVKVGDAVIAGDGTPTLVTGVYPQGEKEIFKVSFSDGASTESCDDHLWHTQTYRERGYAQRGLKAEKQWECGIGKVRSLKEIRETLSAPHLGAKNHSIPIVQPVRFDSQPTPIEPYLLGVLLGDGSLTHGLTISSTDPEIIENCMVGLPAGVTLKRLEDQPDKCPAWAISKIGGIYRNPVRTALTGMGLLGCGSADKFIPAEYIFNTIETRLAILQGLMDTDGSVSPRGHSTYFYTVSNRLADDVVSLVQSLGGTVSRRTKTPSYTHLGEAKEGKLCHVLCIKMPASINPFRLRRKAERLIPKTSYAPVRYITAVESVGEKQAQCISVAHPSHLYVTDNFIVTHNTLVCIAGIMKQKQLGLIRKPIITVPGHTLSQWAREFYLLYPAARILVADETNFVGAKRQRFIARAGTMDWDAIIITHSAFKFIPTPGRFERRMVGEQLNRYEDAVGRTAPADRVSRKRLEAAKEKLKDRLKELRARKDDLLTISQMGVDQIIVDEAQEFRKLSFTSNMANLKGIDPDGSQRAWNLYVMSKFVDTVNPGRSLIMASGTPVTNTMGEMFSLLRYMDETTLIRHRMHEFDAWASSFGDSATELELQPSGGYKMVTRFAKFVNVPELISMFRSIADVVQRDDIRHYLNLPSIQTGKRQVRITEAGPDFKAYQRILAARIKLIEGRRGRPNKGDDIILSVITDGRHAAIDMRFVMPHVEIDRFKLDPEKYRLPFIRERYKTKLDDLIENAFRIWQETADREYFIPGTNPPYMKRGAAQMIFSDLGTAAAADKRGFSAYHEIRSKLIDLGVPPTEIAFMQDYKKSDAKLRLFSDVNAGRIRFLIGSSETMGTGVNAQQRLVALHHLDVPWLPSLIDQREGRIIRQGNQNEEIQVYAYATTRSMDATMWQTNERKARFIAAAMSGDRSLRTIEDVGEGAADQFAMAKALSSGDERLMQKAGLEAEVAKLRRLRSAYFDDQAMVRRQIRNAEETQRHAQEVIPLIEADLAQRTDTHGEAFSLLLAGDGEEPIAERTMAGKRLLNRLGILQKEGVTRTLPLCTLGGFQFAASGFVQGHGETSYYVLEIRMQRNGRPETISLGGELTALGVVSRLEHALHGFEKQLSDAKHDVTDGERRANDYRGRVQESWEYDLELKAKENDLDALNASLAATPEDN